MTSNRDGSYGRINKPIGELDGTVFSASRLQPRHRPGRRRRSSASTCPTGVVVPLDPAQMRVPDGEEASIPGNPAVGMAGGSLAVLDTATGELWATREDPADRRPARRRAWPTRPSRSPRSATTPPSPSSLDGTVFAVSAAEDRLLTLTQPGERRGFAAPTTDPLPGEGFSDAIAMTAVGGVPVLLDSATRPAGRRRRRGGRRCPKGSVLQQPGPSAVRGAGRRPRRAALGRPRHRRGHRRSPTASSAATRPTRSGSATAATAPGPAAPGAVVTACGDSAESHASRRRSTRRPPTWSSAPTAARSCSTTGPPATSGTSTPTSRPGSTTGTPSTSRPRTRTTRTTTTSARTRATAGRRRPSNDNLGARPGRTTILHPLDNDTAPSGRLLAIRSVRGVSGADAQLAISPDGQTVQITLPNDAVGGTSFEYFIDDGRQSVSAHATVRVAITGQAQRQLRARAARGLRAARLDGPRRAAPSTSPCSPTGATRRTATRSPPSPPQRRRRRPRGADDAASPPPAPSASARPAEGGPVQVEYDVSDGLGEPVTETLDFRVQEPDDLEPVAPIAEPDVIAGETGKPIMITPLANDLPGADPLTPDAVLTLAGKVGNVPGADVTTNLVKGTVTLRSDTAQTYFLDYQAAYGTADTATGKIRVDVRAPENPPLDPVAVPDSVTLFGQAGSAGRRAGQRRRPVGRAAVGASAPSPLADNQLDVAVVDGRWLRVSRAAGPAVAQPAGRPLHDQQRPAHRHRRPGRGQPAAAARGQHAGHPERRGDRARGLLAGDPGARQRLQPLRRRR